MKIIADSGSTKTQWSLLHDDGQMQTVYTQGINPYYQTSGQILDSLKDEFNELLHVGSVHFYGAGCTTDEKKTVVANALATQFGTDRIVVKSDLEAAVHALCGHRPGIACILGTGSNSCLFDGEKIAANVSPLGFILGDEGSGAVIGKKLVGDILKNQLPAHVIESFRSTYGLSAADIIEHVYRQPFPNRYLAQFTKFAKQHVDVPEIEMLVVDSFSDFVVRNLLQYPNVSQLPVHFTGSVAYHFLPQLQKVVQVHHLHLGTICLSPMEGLIAYHRPTR